MTETIAIMAAFMLGWFSAVSSGAIFAYVVFRTKKEQHERLFPAQHKKKSGGPIVIDEFAAEAAKDSDEGLPDIIKKQTARMNAAFARNNAKRGEE